MGTPAPIRALVSAQVQVPGPASCSDGTISDIFVDSNDVFDTDGLAPDQSFRWAFDVANTLHMRTRDGFIRSELLFAVGDCYDAFRLSESARLLRTLPNISRADISGMRQTDGSWHVTVVTRDEWTTKLNVRFNFEEGIEFRGIDLTEENFLGRAIEVGAFLLKKDARNDVGGRIFTPRTFGSRLDAAVASGTTPVGRFFQEQLLYPFVGEFGRIAGRHLYRTREDRFTYWADSTTAYLVPFDIEAFDLSMAIRIGDPGRLTVFGLGLSKQRLDLPALPGGIEVAANRDFDNTIPAEPEVAALLAPQAHPTSTTRINFLFGLRSVRFLELSGLDALTGVQDVPLGLDLALTVGKSLGASSAERGRPDDTYARLSAFTGAEAGPMLLNYNLAVEARQVISGDSIGSGWRDLLGELDGLVYLRPERWPAHTFFTRVSGSGGWRMSRPFQLTLGGPEGVRGFREEAYPGGRRLVFSLEDRIKVDWPAPNFVDFGFTLLADVGRMWSGDVPFGVDSGWRGTVGGGLRIGFPAGTRGVVRADLAFPVGDGGIGGPVFRLSLLDVLGLRRVLQDKQLQRSRVNPIGSDLFSQQTVIF